MHKRATIIICNASDFVFAIIDFATYINNVIRKGVLLFSPYTTFLLKYELTDCWKIWNKKPTVVRATRINLITTTNTGLRVVVDKGAGWRTSGRSAIGASYIASCGKRFAAHNVQQPSLWQLRAASTRCMPGSSLNLQQSWKLLLFCTTSTLHTTCNNKLHNKQQQNKYKKWSIGAIYAQNAKFLK